MWILKHQIYWFKVLFPGFELKFEGFPHFLNKFLAFSRSEKVNDRFSTKGGDPVLSQIIIITQWLA